MCMIYKSGLTQPITLLGPVEPGQPGSNRPGQPWFQNTFHPLMRERGDLQLRIKDFLRKVFKEEWIALIIFSNSVTKTGK